MSTIRYAGDAKRIAALESLEAMGGVSRRGLAMAWGKSAPAVGDWIKRFIPMGVVTIDNTVRPALYTVVPNWRERFAQYIEARNEKLRVLAHQALHGPKGEPKPEKPWNHKPSPRLLAKARAVRPDVHTTWRLPEEQARAAA